MLIKTISKNSNIHGYVANIKDLAREVQRQHGLNPVSSALLCRCLSAAALLSGNLKNKTDVLSCIWNCSGPAGRIVTEISYEGAMRGFIDEPHLDLIDGSLSPGTGIISAPYIKSGELHVSRKTFDNRPFYNSVTSLETGEIAQDISVYLDTSLQVQSAVSIGLSINRSNEIEACGGLMFMAMPGADKKEITALYEEFSAMGSLTEILQNDFSKVKEIFDALDLIIADVRSLSFSCSCSRDKVERILRQLDADDLEQYFVDDHTLEAACEYCSRKYTFEKSEFIVSGAGD